MSSLNSVSLYALENVKEARIQESQTIGFVVFVVAKDLGIFVALQPAVAAVAARRSRTEPAAHNGQPLGHVDRPLPDEARRAHDEPRYRDERLNQLVVRIAAHTAADAIADTLRR